MVILDPDQISLLRDVPNNVGEGLVRAHVGVPHRVVVVAIFPEPCRSDFSCRPVPVLTVDLHAKATILQGEGKTREGEKEKNEERETF